MENKNEPVKANQPIKMVVPEKKTEPNNKREPEKKAEPIKKNDKKSVLIAIMLLAAVGICVAGVSLYRGAQEARKNQELLEAMQATESEPEVEAPEAFVVEGWMAEYAKRPDKVIDFDALRQTNEDIYAWITVPGTTIDYPVLFAAKGDERYITHDAEGNESKYGAIFTDGYNGRDFSDPVTVIYGHNMNDGSMFAPLHDFENGDFFDNSRIIYVYIDDVMLEYEIFAAYKTDNTHILYEHDFTDTKVFTNYIDDVYEIRDLNVKLRECAYDANSRIITLATCVHGEDTARYLVQGVLKAND